MTKITAAWFNDIVHRYNSTLGTSISNAVANTKVYGSTFVNMIQTASNAAVAQDYILNAPALSNFGVGQPIKLFAFPTPTYEAGTRVSWNTPGTYKWTVPANCHTVMVNWAIGGGAGGGYGTNYNNGGGGGGGGSGGSQQYTLINCNPSDVLTIVVGEGGIGGVESGQNVGTTAGAGGISSVSLNGTVIVSCGGGQPGTNAQATKGTYWPPGGLGGSPNGLSGQTGQSGSNDYSSCYGGGGAPGPLQGCLGGAGGHNAQPYTKGSDGVGPGSGGGGGGDADRTGANADGSGGAGQPGYVELTWPSQGTTGGTASQNNTGYMVNALTVSGVVGGYPTGGSGYGGGNASGTL